MFTSTYLSLMGANIIPIRKSKKLNRPKRFAYEMEIDWEKTVYLTVLFVLKSLALIYGIAALLQ